MATDDPVRTGAYRWTLKDRKFGGDNGSAFDIIFSKKV